ncbi:AMP-binding protein, partial [Streptomyces sp. NPDC054829]
MSTTLLPISPLRPRSADAPLLVELIGEIDLDALRWALGQVVSLSPGQRLELVVRPLDADESGEEAIDLGTDSVLRVPLLRRGDEGYVLAVASRDVADDRTGEDEEMSEGASESRSPASFVRSLSAAYDMRRGRTVTGWFEHQAELTPEAMAVVCGSVRWSYQELNSRANRLARYLLERGAGPEKLIAVAMDRSADLLAVLLAVLKTGAAYLPLDPSYPRARIDQTLSDARPLFVLTDTEVASAGADATWSAHDLAAEEIQGYPLAPGRTAYVIYTSGSTGRPKGVVVTHASFANLLHAMSARVPLGADDRLLAVTTVAFDIAHLELFLPLLSGAGVVIASREDTQDPQALTRLITQHSVTVMQATPSLWHGLVDGLPSALRVLVGGEALPAALAADLSRSASEVINVYGPTETTIWSLSAEIDATNVQQPSIGRPVANTSVFVLDGDLRPVPVGVAGELY